MKRIFIITILSAFGLNAGAQKMLFSEIADSRVPVNTPEGTRILNIFRNNPLVKSISFVTVDAAALQDDAVRFSAGNTNGLARRFRSEMHEDGDGISWFGRMADETGIFFTESNGQVASKFYMDNTPCLIVPYDGKVHLLISYSHKVDDGVCGTPHHSGKPADDGLSAASVTQKTAAAAAAAAVTDDNTCTMRVLWVVTAQAEPEIPMSLELAARMLQDETNLAYAQSQINYRMEMARVMRTNYVETTTSANASPYGVLSSFPTDIINLRNGTGLLNTVPAMRNLYNADVVVMVRSRATNAAQGIFGVAFGIPIDALAMDATNAFATISTEFMIGGRFTFAHEVGHVQGARHDNDNRNPVHARGFLFSTAANNNRTIMAVGGNCNPPTGCRVQFFSNPNVTFGGIAVGVVNQRDNARRINETGLQARNLRQTSTSLLLAAETFDNEILARHLALQTISTNNSAVVAQAGSRVSMRAGNSISLLPGFVANAGSVFNAYINSCAYVPTTDRQAPVTTATEVKTLVADGRLLKQQMRIAPNPANNWLQIALSGKGERIQQIRVFGNAGSSISMQPAASSGNRINISALPPGLYILDVKTNLDQYQVKFVKE